MNRLRKIILGVALATSVVGLVASAPPVARADYILKIYGPYPTSDERDAAAPTDRSWFGGYLTSPPPGLPGVQVVGYAGEGYYWWAN